MDGDVSHEDGERRAAGLDYREGSPAASRSEEEDRELVLRRRGPTALDQSARCGGARRCGGSASTPCG